MGYETLEHKAEILSLVDEDGKHLDRMVQGQGGYLVAASTPFYGESGGQEGDTGAIESMTGSADVLDTLKPSPELTVHKIFMGEGEFLPKAGSGH